MKRALTLPAGRGIGCSCPARARGFFVIRFLLSFVGAFFSWIVTAAVFAALTVGAIFWMYGA